MYFIDGSAKDKDHNHDGANDIADADNNNDEAVANPHLTVEDSCMNANGAEAGGCRELRGDTEDGLKARDIH